ncbi:hypothetical protein GCM10009117_05530 [Gangjinia marincola]|uniref:Uncharacterized protein n=1 Tax=Gangjinia marincola TaxID=578463 RepID=A0ABN1ME66_9FLAO
MEAEVAGVDHQAAEALEAVDLEEASVGADLEVVVPAGVGDQRTAFTVVNVYESVMPPKGGILLSKSDLIILMIF